MQFDALTRWIAALCALGVLIAPAAAQSRAVEQPLWVRVAQEEPDKTEPAKEEPAKTEDTKASDEAAKKARDEERAKKKQADEFDAAVKDLTRIDGPFPMYIKDGKQVLLELSEEKLGKLWHLQATVHQGVDPFFLAAGVPVGNNAVDTFRFQREGEEVWLIRPNIRFRWDADDPWALASSRAFPEAILSELDIEEEHPEKELLLVDATDLFTGELVMLNMIINAAAGGVYSLDRAKVRVDNAKGFPENTVVRMSLPYKSQGPGGGELADILALLGLAGGNTLEDDRSAPLKVTYNLWYRPESTYRPRLADPRVGYFTTNHFAVDRFFEEDRTKRFIFRYDLRKKDPKAELSEPVEPIVWYIDHSVPEKWRPAVRRGLLMYNTAFEKIGFKNAVVVKDAPTDDPDWDHADGRFNVIRFAMSPDAAYAVALARVDPFTGEVLNAAINVDANMLTFTDTEFERLVSPLQRTREFAQGLLLRSDRTGTAVQQAHDHLNCDHEHHDHTPSSDAFFAKAAELGWSFRSCTRAQETARHAAFAWNALQANPNAKIDKQAYIEQFLAETVAHELGHCLGLRHNFVASTSISVEDLGNPERIAEKGIGASVMDYNPVNIQAVLDGGGFFFSPRVGTYDNWAIEYGYSEVGGTSYESEYRRLKGIAARSGEPGHAYMTDEDADSFNPFATRFDAASDPLDFAALQLQAYRQVRDWAVLNLPKKGESYHQRSSLVAGILSRKIVAGLDAARFVGGLVGNRNFRGDVDEQPTLAPISTEAQRKAMDMIASEVMTITSPGVPDHVLLTMSQDMADEAGSGWQAPLRQFIASGQMVVLATLLSADATDRISENRYKLMNQNNVYDLSEHYRRIVDMAFHEIGTANSIAATRRDLQSFAVSALIEQASAASGMLGDDARVLAAMHLANLQPRLQAALARPGMDDLTRAHVLSLSQAIRRYEDRLMAVPQ